MNFGDNRRTFLSALLLGGGSVAAFGQAFRHGTPIGGSPNSDALFDHIQDQLAAALRTARGRGGYLRAEDVAAGAAYLRICAVHARSLDLDRVASQSLAARVGVLGWEALIGAPREPADLRPSMRRRGFVPSDRLLSQISRANADDRTAALDAVRQGRTTVACDRLAEVLEAAAPRLARDRRFVRRIGDADEGWCTLVIGPWTECLLVAWNLSSFKVPTLQGFLGALWAGIETCDVVVLEQC